ncbi:MAG TPA: hypothetical protein PKB14_08985 [Rubrivivax sp.]|nr:hypothetical protein [Rubrivivax sp.]
MVIAKAGVPVARLTAYTAPRPRIGAPGGMQGEGFWVAPDFDAALPDGRLQNHLRQVKDPP